MTSTTISLLILAAYAVITLLIGLFSSRGQSSAGYLIAGRKMKIWGFVFSGVASYIGGAAIVAYSAFVYQFGITALSVFAGTAIGFLLFIPYAVKLRKKSQEKKYLTLSDLLYEKFGKKTGSFSSVILFVVYIGILLNQFIAGSTILSHISGMSYEYALFFSGIIITVYLVAGGFQSVVKTDIFQYLVLFVLFVLIGILSLRENTGVQMELLDFSRFSPFMTIAFIFYGMTVVFISPEYWQRVYAAENENVVRRGLRWSAVLIIISGFLISIVGLTALKNIPGINGNNAFAAGLSYLLPEQLSGLGLVILFAAIMSSADTVIFVLASAIAKDYFVSYKSVPEAGEEKNLHRNTKMFIIIIAFGGMGLAYFFRDVVTVLMFISSLGFVILPAVLAAFHWNVSAKAVLWSFINGLIYVMILPVLGLVNPDFAVGSFVVAGITLWFVHRFSRREIKKREI
jgi:Na+/proline symporter